MKVYICMDDTDMPGTPGTGHLAEAIRKEVEQNGWGHTENISRHQLYVHENVPFTSHNSTMCFTAHVDPMHLEELKALVIQRLLEGSVEGSDPGFCMAVDEQIRHKAPIIAWGRRAKSAVLTKEEAYQIAADCGVHLSEHGGTGQGIVGALAGVGLRMYGNDGRIKGKIELSGECTVFSAREIQELCAAESVRSIDGSCVAPEDRVLVTERYLKCVWLCWQKTLPVLPNTQGEAPWRTLTKLEAKIY